MSEREPAIEAVVSDLDGVVYRGEAPIDDAVEAFQRWERVGVPYCFVTNNATRSPKAFAEKLTRLGVRTSAAQVVTSPAAAVEYCRERWPAGGPVFVLGAPGPRGLRDRCRLRGDRSPTAGCGRRS